VATISIILLRINWPNVEIKYFLKYKCQDVYTDQWTVFIFDIFCMHENYFCEIMRPPEFRGPAIVNPALIGIVSSCKAVKDCVQDRSANWPGTARWCSSVPTAVYISRRHPDPTKTLVFQLGRSVRSCCLTGYCWTSCFLCRWRSCLERSSCRRHFSTFVHFPKTFKTASLSTLISWPYPLN